MGKQLTIPPVISQEYEQVSVDLIKPHDRNVNQGDTGKIYQSITDNGFYGACIVQRSSRRILAGSHRWGAAKQAGMPAVPVIWADVDDDAALRIMLSDNATARAGNDNPAALAELLAELAATDKGLLGTAFSGDDLDQLISDLAGMPQPGLLADADPDAIPDDAPTRVKPGELWQLGRHRLLCGDSTKPEDVARLMGGQKADMVFTDPPYALFGNSTGVAGITDDKMVRPFFRDIFRACVYTVEKFGHIYVTCDWHSAFCLEGMARECKLTPKNLCIWDKGDGGLGAMYQQCYEMVWFFTNSPVVRGATGIKESGERVVNGVSNIWRIPRVPSSDRTHNAQKPVALVNIPISNGSQPGGIVLDLFIGSGTTLIAAEEADRKCYGMEIETKNCDLTLARWEKATGQTAVLIEPSS